MEGQNMILSALTQQLQAKDKQIELLLITNAELVNEIKKLNAEKEALQNQLSHSSPLPSSAPTTTTTTTTTTQGNKKRKIASADTSATNVPVTAAVQTAPSTPKRGEKKQKPATTPPPPSLVDAEKTVEKEAPNTPTTPTTPSASTEEGGKRKRKRKGTDAAPPQPETPKSPAANGKDNNKAKPTPEKASEQQQKPPKKKNKGAKEPEKPEPPVDVHKIQKQTKAKEGGLAWTDSVVGTGAAAAPGKKLVVGYKGYLRNGKMFDESGPKGFSFRLGFGQVIAGWDKGLIGMRVGGKRKLVIPPKFAYGNKALPEIPPNSTLCFDIELLSVS